MGDTDAKARSGNSIEYVHKYFGFRPYLSSVQELIDWKPDLAEIPSSPFRPSHTFHDFARPRVVVCHDMDGGYNRMSDEVYTLANAWSMIDCLVYFSHHRVTIPPGCWCQRAHSHDIPILGTFITEWAPGIQENRALLCTGPFE